MNIFFENIFREMEILDVGDIRLESVLLGMELWFIWLFIYFNYLVGFIFFCVGVFRECG